MHVLPRALAATVTTLLLAFPAAAQEIAPDSLALPAIAAAAMPPAGATAIEPADATPAATPDVSPAVTPRAVSSGPAIAAARAGVARQGPASGADEYAALRREAPHLNQAQAFMVAGGAGVLVGAVIGGGAGELLMLGGAAVALYGLYQWTQQ